MLEDLVPDCNAVAHAMHPGAGRNHRRSIKFLVAFIQGNALVALDIQGRLLAEYEVAGLIGTPNPLIAAFFHEVLSKRRVIAVDTTGLGAALNRSIPCLAGDKHDRFLLKIAVRSQSCVLVTHDEKAFPRANRTTLRSRIGVRVVDGSEAATLLTL